MKTNRRLVNLLAAGNILVLLMVTWLAFDNGNLTKVMAKGVDTASATLASMWGPAPASIDPATLEMANADLTAAQSQNQELQQMVALMQAREAEYQQTIESANQKIAQLEQFGVSTRAVFSSQNSELGATVQTLQSRETEFQNRINTANQTIRDLESQLTQNQNDVAGLQAQNSELVRMLKVMQEREVQYQAELEAANQALASAAGQGGGAYGGEHHEEHGEHEHDD
ncbi:MAG: hypothetical protein R2911_13260 [Caldilineaceae bacterium]